MSDLAGDYLDYVYRTLIEHAVGGAYCLQPILPPSGSDAAPTPCGRKATCWAGIWLDGRQVVLYACDDHRWTPPWRPL